MKFHNPAAEVFVPEGAPVDAALSRTTHLGIAAHQDDLEIMAYHGILECFGQPDKHFTGVTVTDKKLGSDNSWQAWLSDPDGNRIELHQYTAQSLQTPSLA